MALFTGVTGRCGRTVLSAIGVSAVLFISRVACRAAETVDLTYYLGRQSAYDPAVPTPREYLGFEIGERHLLHHQLVGYLQRLADQSDRVAIREYARSHGQRPLVLLTITTPANQARIDELSTLHRQLADPHRSNEVDIRSLPGVINMGYSVHGNESSAGNAAAVVAYHLAAARGAKIDALLSEVVVLLDPCLNPDGFDRFAHWANNHRGRALNADNQHREHQESWPSGRTNYYWFDLNRDWLPAQHPETQGRLTIARQWIPNVVLDFHEMGGNSTFFFQPGVPRRVNPLTPLANVEFTHRMGDYHAEALDSIRALYFTQEQFDDFYMGKGSTYPDLHGGVGILFEQASSRGHIARTDYGELTFPFTIRNQVRTSLSSLEAIQTLRLDLLEYKRTFYQDALALSRSSPATGFVVSCPGDPVRLHAFLTILERHGIAFAPLAESLTRDGFRYLPDRDVFIPLAQAEHRFLVDLFAQRTTFEESIFYDVSAWTLPLAFGLQFSRLDVTPATRTGEKPLAMRRDGGPKVTFSPDNVAYLIDWRSRTAPRTLYRLLDADVRVRVAQRPFRVTDDDQSHDFPAGTLLVALSHQEEKAAEIQQLLTRAAEEQTPVFPISSSLTDGIDLGSSRFAPLRKPRILLVIGSGVSSYEAGEAWHLLDHVYEMPVTLVDVERLGAVRFGDYDTVIVVSGSYGSVSETAVSNLKRWLSDGGTLIAIGTAIAWLNRTDVAKIAVRANEASAETSPPPRLPYAEASDRAALQEIPGSIFETEVDLTHPLAYGLDQSRLAVLRSNRVILEQSRSPYATPVRYTHNPLLAGYVSPENLARLQDSAAVVIVRSGSGRVVAMADDPNFRAFWYGTNRLFMNAICLGSVMTVPAD
jgi:hypothetical protein